MFYTLSKIHPDDRRGMAQVRALLEQEGILWTATWTTPAGCLTRMTT